MRIAFLSFLLAFSQAHRTVEIDNGVIGEKNSLIKKMYMTMGRKCTVFDRPGFKVSKNGRPSADCADGQYTLRVRVTDVILWLPVGQPYEATYEATGKLRIHVASVCHLGEPNVQCESDSISLLFNSKNPFIGKVFVKGYVGDDNCVQMGDQKNTHRFTVKHDSCGVRRQREVNGVVIITTVIVSFHSIFITKVDRAYRLSCFYVEATKKVQQQLDVASLSTQALEGQTQLPVCRYEILNEGPTGTPIKYAHIGDTVYHKWTCVSELTDVYCMRVHSCTVSDGQGGPPVTVIDTNGCSLDGVILQDLDYLTDLTAGKAAPVFKFADKAGLYFNCQVQLTIKDKVVGCSGTQPQCSSQTYVEPSAKTTEVTSSEYTDSSHESGYPTRPAEAVTADPSDHYATSSNPKGSRTPLLVRPGSNRVLLNLGSGSAGAPGTEPTYEDLKIVTSTADPYREIKDAYTRLVRNTRHGEKREFRLNTDISVNRSQPITVADFDLPERGLIVFGLEDTSDNSHGDATRNSIETARSFLEERSSSSKSCISTSSIFTLLIVILGILLLVSVVAVVVYVLRQRRMHSRSFIKP